MSKINTKNFPFDLILRKKEIALVVPILKICKVLKKFTEGLKGRNLGLILAIFTRF
jgi:hypothetical protein